MDQIPCDNHIRNLMDEVEPSNNSLHWHDRFPTKTGWYRNSISKLGPESELLKRCVFSWFPKTKKS